MGDGIEPPAHLELPGCLSAPEHDWHLHALSVWHHSRTGRPFALYETLRCSHCRMPVGITNALNAGPREAV